MRGRIPAPPVSCATSRLKMSPGCSSPITKHTTITVTITTAFTLLLNSPNIPPSPPASQTRPPHSTISQHQHHPLWATSVHFFLRHTSPHALPICMLVHVLHVLHVVLSMWHSNSLVFMFPLCVCINRSLQRLDVCRNVSLRQIHLHFWPTPPSRPNTGGVNRQQHMQINSHPPPFRGPAAEAVQL